MQQCGHLFKLKVGRAPFAPELKKQTGSLGSRLSDRPTTIKTFCARPGDEFVCCAVHVAAVAPDVEVERARQKLSDVVRWLAKHDVAASHDVYDAHGPDSSRLAKISADLDADLVVAGAYGHFRLQE